MIKTWDNILGKDGGLIAQIDRYDNLGSWAGLAWIIHTSKEVWGNDTFLIVPTANDETQDPIMVLSVREDNHGDWVRNRNTGHRCTVYETSDSGVPYDRVVMEFKEEANSWLEYNE